MRKKTYYATEAQCERCGFQCVEDIEDLFEEFENDIKSIVAVEFIRPKQWNNTLCGLDLDLENPECGLNCEDYEPLNKNSGRCRHLRPALIKSGKKFKLSIVNGGIKNVSELLEVMK